MFSENDQIEGSGLAVLQNFKQLEELDLSGGSISNEQLKSLDGISTLKTINLPNCTRVSGIGIAALTGASSVEELHLSGCKRVDSDDLVEIAQND